MLKSFFIFCSGADARLLESCSPGEHNKYAGVGATVFFTAVFAFLAGSYALFTVFDNTWIAVGAGLLWGLLIFNLDRYIVSTIKKGDREREILQSIPRILLAVIIAIVISKPLELKIFEKEIDTILLSEKNSMTLQNQEEIALQFTPEITAIDNEILGINQSVVTKETEVNALYDTFITEAEGTAGSGILGKGPVYKEKREKHDAALADLAAMKQTAATQIASLQEERSLLEQSQADAVAAAQPTIARFDGLMARITALDSLPWLPSFFIFLLFLAIETSPILAKLISPAGEYDLKLMQQEEHLKTWVKQQKAELSTLLTTDRDLNNKVYADILDEQEAYDYKKQQARQLMRKQADAFFEKQKRILG